MKAAIFTPPGMALVDMAPAQGMLCMIPGAEVHYVWKNKEVATVMPGNFRFQPTTTFEECPDDLDVLLVPALSGWTHGDEESLDFLADRGSRAKWVTSVCGGSLMLGAAGLLIGYKSATHWAFDDLMPIFGAIPTPGRIVEDRNRITADGGSTSIEHAIYLAAKLMGEEFAKDMELTMEWDPQPQYTFGTGTPALAGPERTARVTATFAPYVEEYREILCRSAERLRRKGLLTT